jgi:hypothetical protein
MKIIYTTLAALLLTANLLCAQNARFITSGSVDYEKSVNMYAMIKKLYGQDMDNFSQQALDQYKKNQPQFKVLKSTLTFNGDKTLFTPIMPETMPGNNYFNMPMVEKRYPKNGENIQQAYSYLPGFNR